MPDRAIRQSVVGYGLTEGWSPADIELRDKVKRYLTWGVHGPPGPPQLLHPCYQFMEFTSGIVFKAVDLFLAVQTCFCFYYILYTEKPRFNKSEGSGTKNCFFL
jgi:hypothetical protein